MPRVYSEDMFDEATIRRLENEEDEDFYPFDVPPEAFQYLPPPEFGGPRGVVRVAVSAEQTAKPQSPLGLFAMFGRKKPNSQDEWNAKVDNCAAQLAEEMVKLGAVRACIRYDGGNDEGFAWFEHCVLQDGSTRSVEEIARDLGAAGVKRPADVYTGGDFRNFLEDVIADAWSWRLLGYGWGAGPFVLYGACYVDLKTGVITDDPNPPPTVRNIRFGAG
jgi:hypothetical protein